MGGKGLLKLPWANEGARNGVFLFLAMLYISEFEKRESKAFNGNINLDISLAMQNWRFHLWLAWYCMHVNWWRSITVWILPHLHNLYVSITQSLDNIEMRCNRGLQTSRTLKTEKKGKNGTQFVFCKCIIRFFFSVVQKQHLRLI